MDAYLHRHLHPLKPSAHSRQDAKLCSSSLDHRSTVNSKIAYLNLLSEKRIRKHSNANKSYCVSVNYLETLQLIKKMRAESIERYQAIKKSHLCEMKKHRSKLHSNIIKLTKHLPGFLNVKASLFLPQKVLLTGCLLNKKQRLCSYSNCRIAPYNSNIIKSVTPSLDCSEAYNNSFKIEKVPSNHPHIFKERKRNWMRKLTNDEYLESRVNKSVSMEPDALSESIAVPVQTRPPYFSVHIARKLGIK
jgi:hypothetical protein